MGEPVIGKRQKYADPVTAEAAVPVMAAKV